MAARTNTTKKAPAKKTAAKRPPAKKVAAPRKRVVKVPSKTPAPELNAYVPDPSVHTKYVGRKVYGVYDKVLADIAVRDKKNILIEGDTGSGKTMFGEAYASFTRRLYYRIPCDIAMTTSSLLGKWIQDEDKGKFYFQYGPAAEVVRHGGVLNISEVNMMSPKIAAALYPLLDGSRYIPLMDHKGEILHAHPDLLIIADMNPNYRGTMELNAAFRNRFEFKIKWGYDPEVESRLVNMPTLLKIAGELREQRGREIATPVSTNMLMEFEQSALDPDLGLGFATDNFIAAFGVQEADAIDKVLGLNKTNLEKEAKSLRVVGVDSDDDDDLEDVDWEQEQQS